MSLHSKLAEVMGEVSRIPKNGFNRQQNYRYVTESDLADAVRERLSSRGVMLFTSVVSCDLTPVRSKQGGDGFLANLITKHEFVDGETGEKYDFQMDGAGIDYPGDKSVYKALTGAVKYALMKTFLIPTGDDPEADRAAPAERPDERKGRSGRTGGNAGAAPIGSSGVSSKGEPPGDVTTDVITPSSATPTVGAGVRKEFGEGSSTPSASATCKHTEWEPAPTKGFEVCKSCAVARKVVK